MKSVQIRPPTKDDSNQLSNLMLQLGYTITTEVMCKQIEIYLNSNNYLVYVAERNSFVIGAISCAFTDYFHKQGGFARITSLVVDEDYRNQGVGKGLIRHVENCVYKLGYNDIEITTSVHRKSSGTHNFYMSLGYIDIRSEKVYFRKHFDDCNDDARYIVQ